jgi:hypothetical protein
MDIMDDGCLTDRVDDRIDQKYYCRDNDYIPQKIIVVDLLDEIFRHSADVESMCISFGDQAIDIYDDQQDSDQ